MSSSTVLDMKRTKQHINETDHSYYNNKKQKLQNELTINRPCFEDLANETIYEIFEYLDVYHIYESFFYLNQRFQNLIINTNLPIQINVSTISKSNFIDYYKNVIKPNKDRINYLRLSNPFTVDKILSPPRIIYDLIQLEILILDNITGNNLNNILRHLVLLPKFHSLNVTLIDYDKKFCVLFRHLFRLSKLKSCQITYRTRIDKEPSTYFGHYDHSPIEYLVINTPLRFDLFTNILFYLPQLRYLSIDCLIKCQEKDIKSSSTVLKHLKNVSLNLDSIDFNQFKQLTIYFFYHIEILHLTTKSDRTYLYANKWEELILSSMPSLRIFDLHHDGSAYHDLINQFNSSFWINKKWFFTHQHYFQQQLDNIIFYSTDPYKRKDYTFYWESDQEICSHVQENNLNLVKHLHICSEKATNINLNYFPNVTELTIKHYFKTPHDSISTTLNRIILLKQLKKLVIQKYYFPFKEIIKLLYFTPNLHELKLNSICLNRINLEFLENDDIFQYVSNTNKVHNFEVNEYCITMEKIQLIMNLFSQVEYLKIRMQTKEQIIPLIQYLLSKINNKTSRLLFLHIKDILKTSFEELNMFLKSENCFIKYINHDLYLWW